MTKERKSESEWEIIRKSLEMTEGGAGFSTEFKSDYESSREYLIVTDLDTHDKTLDIFPIPDEHSENK